MVKFLHKSSFEVDFYTKMNTSNLCQHWDLSYLIKWGTAWNDLKPSSNHPVTSQNHLNPPTISHINYWDQVDSCKYFWKFWNGLPCRNTSALFPLLNVAAYWQGSYTEACANKLSQILANNIDHGGRGIGLRIYVRYCLKK